MSDTSGINNYDPNSTATLDANLEEPTYTLWPNNPLRLVYHPDPVLRNICEPVTDFSLGERRNLLDVIRNMKNVMQAHKGIGLAAPQVGWNKRVVLVGTTVHSPIAMVNPVIISSEKEQVQWEGCLSFPQLFMNVKRAAKIAVQYQDEFGEVHELNAQGLFATCIQHEIDHLNGVLFIDNVSKVRLNLAIKKQQKKLRILGKTL